MLPQKFSAATTSSLPGATPPEAAPPERPQPAAASAIPAARRAAAGLVIDARLPQIRCDLIKDWISSALATGRGSILRPMDRQALLARREERRRTIRRRRLAIGLLAI